jgi:hypothetical protein
MVFPVTRLTISSSLRPTAIEITTGGTTTVLDNLLDSVNGEEWDTLTVSANVPAGATLGIQETGPELDGIIWRSLNCPEVLLDERSAAFTLAEFGECMEKFYEWLIDDFEQRRAPGPPGSEHELFLRNCLNRLQHFLHPFSLRRAQVGKPFSSRAAKAAEHGIVKIHAHTMLRATPQRTADRRIVDPAPTIAPVIVCVVLSGMPRNDRRR